MKPCSLEGGYYINVSEGRVASIFGEDLRWRCNDPKDKNVLQKVLS
jgi:hypothetical protein